MLSRNARRILGDAIIVAASIVVAIILAKSDLLVRLIERTKELELLGTFIVGMFFTSAFTTAPAIATLGEVSLHAGIWPTVLLGALGAVVGDMLIFKFVQNHFAAHVVSYVTMLGGSARLERLLERRSTRWLSRGIGIFVLASPLPDELGIALLGISHLRTIWLLPIAFVANALGILAVCWAARLI